jgi:hypothetical protein
MEKYNFLYCSKKDLKFLMIILAIVLFIILTKSQLNALDNDLRINTIKGMRIESFQEFTNSIKIRTTGAIFIIDHLKKTIEIYQKIGRLRKLAEISVSGDIIRSFKKKPHDTGFEYAWFNKNLKDPSVVISGDSVIRFYNLKNLKIQFFFKPLYNKINDTNNGLVYLDDVGGIVVMPPDNLSINENKIIVENNKWELNSNSEVSILFVGICPPREFDWDRSKWPIIHYSSHTERYPSDLQIKEFSNFAKVLELHQWIWKNQYENKKDCLSSEPYNNCDSVNTPLWFDNSYRRYNKQYLPDNDMEFRRVISTAHTYGMLVTVYFNGLDINLADFLFEVSRLKNEYNIDGIYLDGLLINVKKEGPLDRYLAAREIRRIFGDYGWINYHNTHNGYFEPFVQTYMDFITTGEHNKFDRWISTTFNISNSIGGHWPEIPYFYINNKKNIKDAREYLRELVDISLKYHNRVLFLVGKNGQWRFWRLYFSQDEMNFMKNYYLKKIHDKD